MLKIKDLIEELQDMYGKEMGSGYFKHIVKEPSNIEIDISNFLENLKSHEVDLGFDNEMDVEDYLDDWYEEKEHMNTYNWSSPISNDIDYIIYKHTCTDEILVRLMVHYGISDVRCGYSDYIYLQFDTMCEMDEAFSESDKYLTFEIIKDYETLEVEVGIMLFSEGVTIEINGEELDWEESEEILDLMEEQGLIN